jgi:dienelactone hydrolase
LRFFNLCFFIFFVCVSHLLSANESDKQQPLEAVESNVVANLYLPEKVENPPVSIVLCGFNGGMRAAYDERLVEEGFAALILAYFRYKELPETLGNIPIYSVSKGFDFLETVESIDASKVEVWAASRGGELAALAATHEKRIRALALTTPTNVAWHGQRTRHAWTLNGEPSQSMTFEWRSVVRMFERASLTLNNEANVEKAMFPFENVNGPILLVSARNDGFWPSSDMSVDIEQYLKTNNFPHMVSHVPFATGHTFSQETRPLVTQNIVNHFRLSLSAKAVNISH